MALCSGEKADEAALCQTFKYTGGAAAATPFLRDSPFGASP